mmetsp:Transcript_5990/g.19545  ORF Transcript_5990/g.19545 Transcript_5990/m.19545 type:complete len:202 (-) Transcript_5990:129-734(-)
MTAAAPTTMPEKSSLPFTGWPTYGRVPGTGLAESKLTSAAMSASESNSSSSVATSICSCSSSVCRFDTGPTTTRVPPRVPPSPVEVLRRCAILASCCTSRSCHCSIACATRSICSLVSVPCRPSVKDCPLAANFLLALANERAGLSSLIELRSKSRAAACVCDGATVQVAVARCRGGTDSRSALCARFFGRIDRVRITSRV